MDEMHIICNEVSKNYHLSWLNLALSVCGNLLGKQKIFATNRVVKAVQKVSVTINRGERVGIIGPNGAGKTTLLRMIAGLMEPTSGRIEVEGHVNCVMTLGVGLREDLPGRENIYIDGEIQGTSRKEISERIDDIINFADLGEFIDYPVKTYSSGMKARLAFAMITHIEPEILIIDEALSVGDVNFSAKASAKMKDICAKGKIVIIVSHNLGAIMDMCNRCLWMDQGRIVMDGNPFEVTKAYLETVVTQEEGGIRDKMKSRLVNEQTSHDDFAIRSMQFLDKQGQAKVFFNVGEDLTISFVIYCPRALARPNFALRFIRSDEIVVTENLSGEDGFVPELLEGETEIWIKSGPIRYGKGLYEVVLQLTDATNGEGTILAALSEVIKVENFYYPYENPIYFHRVSWGIN